MSAPYYQDSLVTIYHGRCEEVLPHIEGISLLLSDPPYGMNYQHGARKGGRKMGMDGEKIIGDDSPFDPSHLLTLAPKIILWGGNHFASRLPDSKGWLVWDKRDGSPSNDQSDCEMAWTNFLTVARFFTARWSGGHRTGREQKEGRLHVNQKPVALMDWCIRLSDSTGLICDPYCGSGSTLVAGKEASRPVIGIEAVERNCEIAAERCRQETLFGEVA